MKRRFRETIFGRQEIKDPKKCKHDYKIVSTSPTGWHIWKCYGCEDRLIA